MEDLERLPGPLSPHTITAIYPYVHEWTATTSLETTSNELYRLDADAAQLSQVESNYQQTDQELSKVLPRIMTIT